MSHVCKICGKAFETLNGVSGHMRIHSASSLSHVCKICGKKFATSKSLCNHKRIHSCQRNRMVDENEILFLLWIWGLGFPSSLKESSSSSMTEIEQDEMNEAALSLVMFSEQVYDFPPPSGDSSMDLEVKPMQENILHCVESSYKCKIYGKSFVCSQALGSHQRVHRSIKGQLARKKEDFEVSQEVLAELRDTTVKEHCVESKEEFIEMLKSSTCSDVVVQALHSPLRSNSSYRCRICGKTFGCYQALGGHQGLHRGQLARKREDFEGGNSLSGLSQVKKIVSQPSSFEVSQEKLIELNVNENCVESTQDFSEMDFEKSSDVFVAQALLPSPLRSKLQRKPASNSSRVCRICGKTFWCYQALGGHLKLRRCQIARERMIYSKMGKSLSDSPEANKIVSQESSFEILM